MRKSSRGNPWHDKLGRFCHGPYAEIDTWGNPISDKQRKESVLSSEKTNAEYEERTRKRLQENVVQCKVGEQITPGVTKQEKGFAEHDYRPLKQMWPREKNDAKRRERLKGKIEGYEEVAEEIGHYVNDEDYDSRVIDRYIESAPALDKKLYRGMKFDSRNQEAYKKFANLKEGDMLAVGDNASWTSDRETAQKFSGWEYKKSTSVLIICVENKTSVSVTHLSEHNEWEAISHSKAKWVVVNVKKYKDVSERTIIRVREV